ALQRPEDVVRVREGRGRRAEDVAADLVDDENQRGVDGQAVRVAERRVGVAQRTKEAAGGEAFFGDAPQVDVREDPDRLARVDSQAGHEIGEAVAGRVERGARVDQGVVEVENYCRCTVHVVREAPAGCGP